MLSVLVKVALSERHTKFCTNLNVLAKLSRFIVDIHQNTAIQHNQSQAWLYSTRIEHTDNIPIKGPQLSNNHMRSL